MPPRVSWAAAGFGRTRAASMARATTCGTARNRIVPPSGQLPSQTNEVSRKRPEILGARVLAGRDVHALCQREVFGIRNLSYLLSVANSEALLLPIHPDSLVFQEIEGGSQENG